jgi:putative ABC transport system substrate-binding protein
LIEGNNIALENRWAGEPSASAVDLAAELVRLKVDVIVAVGSPLIQAANQATNAIPIVMSGTGADRSQPVSSPASDGRDATSPD